ncbi:Lipase (class 3) [Marinomonas spartinae]|uniref:lipase family protein n=1 Tax=Marinomonas spartinae TaxID=1792290 RepID=UPI000808DA8D|nr:lipase family protein [Marinomonas spartinae]SBS40090.1 Lipase (class 3) [Marinomonas spartinae]
MTTLTPKLASKLAALPYDFIRGVPSGYTETSIDKDIRTHFDMDFKNGGVQGVAGGLVFQLMDKQIGFAIVGKGVSEGFKNHLVISIRGTKTSRDWLTNPNMGMVSGPGGQMVHAGFYKVFASLKNSLRSYIAAHNPQYIHCIGHSLGGAIATITASWIKHELNIPVSIYTFGAPRVGCEAYAKQVKNSIPVYRVTHGTDIVPMIPLWPFMHADNEYLLAATYGARMSTATHSMSEPTPGYVNTASNYDSYDSMAIRKTTLTARKRIKLDYNLRFEASFSQKSLQVIHNAIVSLLVDAGYSLAAILNNSLLSTMTAYDLLARAINDIALISKGKHEDVKGILGYMAVFCNMTVDISNITISLIKKIFSTMTKILHVMAKQAISMY